MGVERWWRRTRRNPNAALDEPRPKWTPPPLHTHKDETVVVSLMQTAEYLHGQILDYASTRPESQWLYEAWNNAERTRDLLSQYLQQRVFPDTHPERDLT